LGLGVWLGVIESKFMIVSNIIFSFYLNIYTHIYIYIYSYKFKLLWFRNPLIGMMNLPLQPNEVIRSFVPLFFVV
jgi:hypothetical protein